MRRVASLATSWFLRCFWLLAAMSAVVMSAHAAPAPAGLMDDAQLKAAFVYRFAQFTQWPPPPLQEFTYCVAGSQGMQESMQALTQKAHQATQVRMRYLTDPQQLGQCQLLFLGFVERADLQRWQEAAGNGPLLVVADNVEAFRSGAVIGLIAEPNGLSFRINLTEARRRGLSLSSQMLKLAREVR